MSDLLKKDKYSILDKPKDTPKPNQVFDRQRLFTMDETKREKEKKKSTTIRCSQEMSNMLNAIIIVKGLDTVDELLNHMTTEYLKTLSEDARREYELVLKLKSRRK